MFEYIKRVSIAISFIADKIENKNSKVSFMLKEESLEFLRIAQNFRIEDLNTLQQDIESLQDLKKKILYIIDIIDFARISYFISAMNSKVFIDSLLKFLKHIYHLIEQKNNSYLPLFKLENIDDVLARKIAKENVQNVFNDNENMLSHFEFTKVPSVPRIDNAKVQESNNFNKNTVENKEIEKVETIADVESEEEFEKFIEKESTEKEVVERRKKILKSLITGGGSIKDIAVKCPDINEKTIQRDLIELMHDKKVIMLGKKRWAKYYLK